jgi:hypothetical protein
MPAIASAAIAGAGLLNSLFGSSPAKDAAKAQSRMLGQRSDLFDQLQGLFDRPNVGFQSDALSAALADPNLLGMAPGFARMQLVKNMLGIGQPGTGGIHAELQERGQDAASAQAIGEVLGMLLSQSADPGQGVTAAQFTQPAQLGGSIGFGGGGFA